MSRLASFLDLKRLVPHAQLAGLLLCGLLTLNAGLSRALDSADNTLPVPTLYNWQEFEFVGGRIAQLEDAIRQDAPDRRKRVGVIIGSSSTRDGVDSRTVEENDGLDIRWIVLAGGGRNFGDLAYLSKPLEDANFRPDVIVLDLHLVQFRIPRSESPGKLSRPSPNPSLTDYLGDFIRQIPIQFSIDPEYTKGGAPETAIQTMTPVVLAIRRLIRIPTVFMNAFVATGFYEDLATRQARVLVSLNFKHFCLRARLHLMRRLQGCVAGLFPKIPYRMQPLPNQNIFAKPDLNSNIFRLLLYSPLKFMELAGELDSDNYTADSEGARGFIVMLNWLRQFDVPVYLILMPEKEVVREAVPSRGRELLDGILKANATDQPVSVVDMRASMEDSQFPLDGYHLSRSTGRPEFSAKLARELGTRIKHPVASGVHGDQSPRTSP